MNNTLAPQTVQDLFSLNREQWLNGARKVAYQLLQTRLTITIEDVLELYPRPKYLHRNTTGSVFKDEWFQPVGYVLSKRVISHGRVIRLWSLSEKFADKLTKDYEG
ncbi:MAG: hypothetical protein JWR59_2516 [Brevundimonas sp.]|nr:hypothetical protein [Brevundimonas sp.]